MEIDMERKEELIMAKKLRACRVTILPKAPPGKCFTPEVVPAKLRPKKEPVQISMTHAYWACGAILCLGRRTL